MKQRFPKLFKAALLAFIFLVLSACAHLQIKEKGVVYPLERMSEQGNLQRQRVDLNWVQRGKLEQVIISTMGELDTYSELAEWAAEDDANGRVERFSGGQLFVYYLGKMIFSPAEELSYDYVSFIDVCEGPDGLDRLQFQMLRGGTANADIDDRLFLYYDESSKGFEYEIIENRYLLDSCNLEVGNERGEQVGKEREALRSIFEQLRPSEDGTYIDEYACKDQPLPTKTFLKAGIEKQLEQVRDYIGVEIEPPVDVDERKGGEWSDGSEMFLPSVVINDVAENELWRIVEVSYYEIWESWGVLLAENKRNGEWTAFYNIPVGGSKVFLYLSEDIELVGSSLRGSFCIDCSGWGNFESFEVALDDFTVHKTHGYRFVDYPVKEVYDGPIAELDRKSHELAQVFPTRIREQLAGGADFAGHYSVMEAGCGTECQMIVITDVITGKVIGGLTARAGVEFKLDSQLIITDSDPFCVSEGLCEPAYYELESGKLIELRNE